MKAKRVTDSKLRLQFAKAETTRLVLKYLFVKYPKTLRLQRYYVKKYNSTVSKTRIVRRCIINNRSRGVVRAFGISRILLKDYLVSGYIPGYVKAVW
jgi:ribosomal protein S14